VKKAVIALSNLQEIWLDYSSSWSLNLIAQNTSVRIILDDQNQSEVPLKALSEACRQAWQRLKNNWQYCPYLEVRNSHYGCNNPERPKSRYPLSPICERCPGWENEET